MSIGLVWSYDYNIVMLPAFPGANRWIAYWMKHHGLSSQFPIERDVNPTQFDELMKEWNEVIHQYLMDSTHLVFHVQDMACLLYTSPSPRD